MYSKHSSAECKTSSNISPSVMGTVEYAYPGGVYKNKLSVFEELEKMGVHVREEDKYEKWFSCYDFEP